MNLVEVAAVHPVDWLDSVEAMKQLAAAEYFAEYFAVVTNLVVVE